MWFAGPHEPWDTPAPWATMHDAAAAPPPAPVPSSNYERPEGYLDDRLSRRPDLSPEHVAAMRADYAGNVALIDDLVGRIFGVVRDRKEWDDTIVVFTSDHGEMNGDAGLVYKNVFLDGSCRVPLLIRDPATKEARDITAPVEMFDLAPTMLDLAGIDDAGFGFARSLAPAVRGQASRPVRVRSANTTERCCSSPTSGRWRATAAGRSTCSSTAGLIPARRRTSPARRTRAGSRTTCAGRCSNGWCNRAHGCRPFR